MQLFSPDNFHFNCDYCPETFQSRAARITHTGVHFKSKSCLSCKKILICINGDWYDLHASVECHKENSQPKHNDSDGINDVKVEEFVDYTADDMCVKSEQNDSDSNVTGDDLLFDDQPNLHHQIEVNLLPEIENPIVKVDLRRTKIKKTKYSIPKKAKVAVKPSIVKKEKSSNSNVKVDKAHKVRKKIDKVTFLDHRPKSTCICDICNKTLGTFSSLRNHIINIHCLSDKSQRASCNECGQTFSTPGNLNSHKKIHLKCKAYVCTYCGRGFNQLHNLKEHTNRHTGEKPYKCTVCDKVKRREKIFHIN